MRNAETAVSPDEARVLFGDLQATSALVLAVSGGPDSVALLLLAARWRDKLKTKPKLIAVTVDHGLRRESKAEAAAVARLARKLKVTHRILPWRGRKPKTGLPQAARNARYELLARVARSTGASHILTAHTLDDQAETVLIRMARGSGIAGLGAMARMTPLPTVAHSELMLLRPFLEIPKMRLVATARTAKAAYAQDPTNIDPRFTRARLRGLMPVLAQEGLDARRLSLLARRLRRANAALEVAVNAAQAAVSSGWDDGRITLDASRFLALPAEIALRLLGRAVTVAGDEGPIELGKLEALAAAIRGARGRFRRTLAGALITAARAEIVVERAPARRFGRLTKRGRSGTVASKSR